jgi:hypothetical protein
MKGAIKMQNQESSSGGIGDFFWEVGVNTVESIWDLTPEIFKNKNHRILFASSTILGAIPIIKFDMNPKHWFIFGANYFVIAGTYRAIIKGRYKKMKMSI